MSNNESIESRLARAGRNLDAASEQYANRQPGIERVSKNKASNRLRFGLVAGVVGIAASMTFAVVIARRDATPITPVDRVQVAAPGNDDFTTGNITLEVPGPTANSPGESVLFRNGVGALNNATPLTITSTVRTDINNDGVEEVAALIERAAGKTQPGRAVVVFGGDRAHPVSIVRSKSFQVGLDELLVENGKLLSLNVVSKSLDTQTVIVIPLIEQNSVLVASGQPRQINRVALPEGSTGEIRFAAGTTSALVDIGPGARSGWFLARAGQTIRIEVRRIDGTTTRRTLTVTSDTNAVSGKPISGKSVVPDSSPPESAPTDSNPPASVGFPASVVLPASMNATLPATGRYDLSADNDGHPVTIELTIE
jgi:hypothetical protein